HVKSLRTGLSLVAASNFSAGYGFELVTHAAITKSAYSRFMRDSPTKFAELGVLSFLSEPLPRPIFGHLYYDVSIDPTIGRLVLTRHDWDFEGTIIDTLGEDPLSIAGWLMRGAIREDDGIWPINKNPQDDTYPGLV